MSINEELRGIYEGTLRRCTRCRRVLPMGEFAFNSRPARKYECRPCTTLRNREYYQRVGRHRPKQACTPKTYDSIVVLELAGELDCVYAKGHHDACAFKEAVEEQRGCWGDGTEKMRHEWFRSIPCRGGEFDYLIYQADPRARGAFPVTVMGQSPCHHRAALEAIREEADRCQK